MIAELNDTLLPLGVRFRQTKTKIRIEDLKGNFLRYKNSLIAALKSYAPAGYAGLTFDDLLALGQREYVPLTEELRKSLVQEAIDVWNEIAYDWLQLFDNHECSAEDAREGVGDRMENRTFYRLSSEDQNSILVEAIPNAQSM
jgi:hypothetical protein